MKGIFIKLKDHMGGDMRVFEAAKATMDDDEIQHEENPERLIKFLAAHRHITPFRHPQITLSCESPIFVARQLGKHQVGFSWNERSMRYRDSAIGFFSPEHWRGRPKNLHEGSTDVIMDDFVLFDDSGTTVHEAYQDFINYAELLYNKFIEVGVAPEQSRMLLPQSMITRWVWTGSLYGFFEVYRQRISKHAQLEVNDFAKQLDVIMNELYPIAWAELKATIKE